MDLRTHLSSAPKGAAARYARALKVSPVMLSQWAAGKKDIPVDRCSALEQATGGLVRRWDLRPRDWHIHWPELVGKRGAPSPTGQLFGDAGADSSDTRLNGERRARSLELDPDELGSLGAIDRRAAAKS